MAIILVIVAGLAGLLALANRGATGSPPGPSSSASHPGPTGPDYWDLGLPRASDILDPFTRKPGGPSSGVPGGHKPGDYDFPPIIHDTRTGVPYIAGPTGTNPTGPAGWADGGPPRGAPPPLPPAPSNQQWGSAAAPAPAPPGSTAVQSSGLLGGF